jgi:uncharacterized membrane protein HdeD (DUF308 family)
MVVTAAGALKRGAGFSIFIGIMLVILGILAIGSPLMAGIAVAYLVGTFVLVGGILQTAFAFRAKSWGWGILTFLLGALTVALGIVMIADPLWNLGLLTIFLAVYFFVDGAVEIVHAFQVRPIGGWGWMLFSGIVAVLLAIMIWRQWPLSGAWAIGILVGVKILFNGWAMIALGMAARGAVAEATAS